MIVVAGSINLDLIARVKHLPKPGQTVSGVSYSTAPGGKGANQALAAGRADASVSMIGAIGADENAAAALQLLSEADIDLSHIQHQPAPTTTGVALILVDNKTGENQIAVVPGANHALEPSHAALLKLHEDDYLVLQMEVEPSFNKTALLRARQAGANSVLNIAPYGSAAPELALLADYVIANEDEFDSLADAMSLKGDIRIEKASDFQRQTGRTIIVTLGPEGAFAAGDNNTIHASSPQIKPIDTVGAGDTFCGTFAVALSEGLGLKASMEFACRAGALACLKHGAQPSIPTRAEIDAFNA